MDQKDRAVLAGLITTRRERKFGTKSAAYSEARVNAATWDKAEAGETVRPDLMRKIIRTLWPETEGDWTEIEAPTDSKTDALADLRQEVRELRREVETLRQERFDERA